MHQTRINSALNKHNTHLHNLAMIMNTQERITIIVVISNRIFTAKK